MILQTDIRRLREMVRMRQVELALASRIDHTRLCKMESGFVPMSEEQLRSVERALRNAARKLVRELVEFSGESAS